MAEAMIKLNSVSDIKEFVRYANEHNGDITLYSGKYVIDAKSVMGVFSLDLSKPIKMEVEGDMPLDVRAGIGQFIVEG